MKILQHYARPITPSPPTVNGEGWIIQGDYFIPYFLVIFGKSSRFGLIISLVALRLCYPGEEVLKYKLCFVKPS